MQSSILILTPDMDRQLELDLQARQATDRALLQFQTGDQDLLLCLRYLSAYLPDTDRAMASSELLVEGARLALHARRTLPFAEMVDTELFLNSVLPLRVGTEDLSDHRSLFQELLLPRVKGLTDREAACEVNWWCAEHVCYQPTHLRTASPLATFHRGFGRCGEESVFCVAALRSVGLPARQVYAPWWGHCDDNHAWVEVHVGGAWHFLGACEPEPDLDRGWFVGPAKRALYIHTRVDSSLTSDDSVLRSSHGVTELNRTAHYAPVTPVHVQVLDPYDIPIAGAVIRLGLINEARLSTLFQTETDACGRASFDVGRGEVIVEASYSGLRAERLLDLGKVSEPILLRLSDAPLCTDDFRSLKLTPPVALPSGEPTLPEKTRTAQAQRLAHTEACRKRRLSDHQNRVREKLKHTSLENVPGLLEKLDAAGLNGLSLLNSLLQDSGISSMERALFLTDLDDKDLTDLNEDTLFSLLSEARRYRNDHSEEVYRRWVRNPRIGLEPLRPFHQTLLRDLSDEGACNLRKYPGNIFQWVDNHIENSNAPGHEKLLVAPAALYAFGRGNRASKKALSIAFCRALGIPARLNEADGRMEVLQDGKWLGFTQQGDLLPEDASLNLWMSSHVVGGSPACSLTRLLPDGPMNIILPQMDSSSIPLNLLPGMYHVMVAQRYPDGTVCGMDRYIRLSPRDAIAVELPIPSHPPGQTRQDVALPPIPVILPGGAPAHAQRLLEPACRGIILCMEETGEPSTHLMEELIAQSMHFQPYADRILILRRTGVEPMPPSLQRVITEIGCQSAALPETEDTLTTWVSQHGDPSLGDPLVLALNADGTCAFHLSGYHVGTAALLLYHLTHHPS